MKSEKLNSFLNGAGFYIVLFLTIAVIGASGYFIYSTVSGNRSTQTITETQPILSEQPEHLVPAAPAEAAVTPSSVPERQTVAVSGTVEIPAKPAAEPADSTVVLPVRGETVTPFSMEELLYSQTMDDWRTHNGVDIAAEEGTPVAAAAAGKVTSVVNDYRMGSTVTIACGDSYELTYASLAHPEVSAGDAVRPGDTIGSVGTTSLQESAIGPHLHFSVTRNGVFMDPAVYLSKADH